MSPSRVLAVLSIVAVAAIAVAFTLARQPEYRASVAVVAVERGPLRPSIGPEYLRGQLDAGRSELATRLERSGIDPGLLASVRVRRAARPRGAVAVTAAASTPARATELLRLVVLQIDSRSAAELERVARRRLRATEAALASSAVTPAQRPALQRRARELRRYLEDPRGRFGAMAVRVERPERWADRLARSLPGAFPARPSPIWAGLAGAFVGAALAFAVGLLGRRRWAP